VYWAPNTEHLKTQTADANKTKNATHTVTQRQSRRNTRKIKHNARGQK